MINDFGDKYKCLNVLKDLSKIKKLNRFNNKKTLNKLGRFLKTLFRVCKLRNFLSTTCLQILPATYKTIIFIYYAILKLNCRLLSRIIPKKYIRVEHYMTWLSLLNVFPLLRNSELIFLCLDTNFIKCSDKRQSAVWLGERNDEDYKASRGRLSNPLFTYFITNLLNTIQYVAYHSRNTLILTHGNRRRPWPNLKLSPYNGHIYIV